MAKEESIVTSRRRVVSRVLLVLAVGSVIAATPFAAAQSTPQAGFVRTEMRITGDGPWTSWLGGAADRTIVVTIENTGAEPLRDPVIELWLTTGGEQIPIPTPALDDLGAGERTTLDLDLTLPRFSFGTHAVEGTVSGATEPVPLRAETSHVPWLLLLLPSIVLAQVGLVSLRDRARRRLHAHPNGRTVLEPVSPSLPAARSGPDAGMQARHRDSRGDEGADRGAPDPRPGLDPDIATFIDRTLDQAVTGLDRWPSHDERFLADVHRRARATTASVADRFAIPYAERPALAAQITRALLDRTTSPRALPR